MRISISTPFIIGVVCSLSFLGCNPKKTDDSGSSDLNKNPQTQSENLSEVNQEEKTLLFEQQYGPYDNQKYSYKLTIKGIDVNIQYSSGEFHQNTKALFKEGKLIVTEAEGCPPGGDEGCPAIGDSEYFVLDQNGFGVHNSEGGGIIYIPFIQSKSTHSIEDVLNPEVEGYFKGQKLEPGEKIIKVNWAMENETNFTNDFDKDENRFSSKTMRVPNGKIWILLYLDERYNFESGSNLYIVPYLFINNVKMEWDHRRKFSEKENINISKAKVENVTFYPNESITAISNRQKGRGAGKDFIDYNGEMWFLETTNTDEMEQLRMKNELKNLREQNNQRQREIDALNRSERHRKWKENAMRKALW